jgi:hypothetical protein
MLAGADFGQSAEPGGGWTITSIIERLAAEGLLAAEPAGAAQRSPQARAASDR